MLLLTLLTTLPSLLLAAQAFAKPIAASTPTTSSSAPTPSPSRYPPGNYSGRILVKDTKGNILGFVSETLTDKGVYTLRYTDSVSSALYIHFVGDTNANTEAASGIEFQIVRADRPDPDYQYIAGVIPPSNSNDNSHTSLSPGSANFAYLSPSMDDDLVNTKASPGRSLFNAKTNSNEAQETRLWTYTPSSGAAPNVKPLQQLTATWTNADGSFVSAAIVAGSDGLVLTGDSKVYISKTGGYEVHLFLD